MDSPQHDERSDEAHALTGGSRKRERGEEETGEEVVRNQGLLDLSGGREGRKKAREADVGFGVLFSTTTTTSPFLPASPPPLTRNGSTSTASSSTPAFELISPRTPAFDLYPSASSSSALPKPTSSFLDLPEDHNAEFDFETFNAFSWGATEGKVGDVTGLGLGIWAEAEGIGLVMPSEGDGDERRVDDVKQQQQPPPPQQQNFTFPPLPIHINAPSSDSSSSHLLQESTSNSITTSLMTHSLIHHTLRSSSSYPVAQRLPTLSLPASTSYEPAPAISVVAQPPHPTTGTFGDYDLDVDDEAQLSPFAIGLKKRRETETKFKLRWMG